MTLRAAALAPFLTLLAGCNSEHSTLAPHSIQATQIATLTWVLIALVLVVSLVVFAAAWIAIRGDGELRRRLAHRRTVVIGGIAFPAATLSVLLAYGLWLMREPPAHSNPVQIEISGEQWWWRVRYPTSDRSFERANDVRIPVGEEVEFILQSADVIHSFWVPSLGGKVDMIPGRTNRLRVLAQRPGVYRGICAEYCGGAHAFMMLDVVAVSSAEFEDWLDAPASSPAQSKGRDLFEKAGCGGCHAIEGTPAKGTIGPNLTGFGARRHIGAGRLTMTKENLMRFVADSREFKPGNAMPPFPILSRNDLESIASYLLDLK